MYKFLWFLLLLFERITCEEIIPNIAIILEKGKLTLKHGNPILLENKPFRMIVENSLFINTDVINIKCLNEFQNIIFNKPLKRVKDQYVVNVNKAYQSMAATWNCKITEKNLSISFPAHVRLMDVPGELRVNDNKIELNVVDISVTDYDAVGEYYYRDGELAKFTCRKNTIGHYSFRAFHFNISGSMYMTTTAENDSNVYLKMGYIGLPKYIDCVMSKFIGPAHSIIRLILERSTNKIVYPQFQVNGLSLRPSGIYYKDNYTFVYEYYPGEILDVSSNLDAKIYKSLSCFGENLPPDNNLTPDTIPELRMTISTEQLLFLQTSVSCLVERYRKANAQVSPNVQVSIIFHKDLMTFSPNLIGIQWSKIIAKFIDVGSSNNAVGTLYALYKSYDKTILHCSCNENIMKCNYDAEVNSTRLTTTTTESQYRETGIISSGIIKLKNSFSKNSFECKYENKTSKVVLVQQIKPTYPTTLENTANGNSNTDTDLTTTNDPDKEYTENAGLLSDENFLPIIIGVTSIIIILLIITLIVCICKRKKLPKADVNINYENLPAHNEGTMPIPSQWNTNNSTNENIEDSYAKVIPKNQRTKITEIYSVPLSNTKNQCYASPYKETLESPYAEIVIKSQDNGNTSNDQANVNDNYAQIAPKVLRNVAQNQVLPTNNEIGTNMRNRVNTDKHKYANVFNSELYANVSSSDG